MEENYARGDQIPFMTKDLSKKIMKMDYANLNEKNIQDNKQFWKVVKLLFSIFR